MLPPATGVAREFRDAVSSVLRWYSSHRIQKRLIGRGSKKQGWNLLRKCAKADLSLGMKKEEGGLGEESGTQGSSFSKKPHVAS